MYIVNCDGPFSGHGVAADWFDFPANTSGSANSGLMLGQRNSKCATVKQTIAERIVLGGILSRIPVLFISINVI